MKPILKIIFICLLVFISISVVAQKLPNVQKVSLWAPAGIKIDGKTTEWNDKYQAYNNATDIYYTLSNDNENIYLAIKAVKSGVIEKIIQYGISFTINHTLKKKDASPVTITYPVLQKDRWVVSGLFDGGLEGVVMSDASGVDKSIEGLNKLFAAKSKFINVKGIKEISDENISVYNERGIKAVAKFDKPRVYVYELAIPLKYLALPNSGADGFTYHIKLNVDEKLNKSAPIIYPDNPPEPARDPVGVSATDFLGEYTLAKKP